jgi:hypothetical protein
MAHRQSDCWLWPEPDLRVTGALFRKRIRPAHNNLYSAAAVFHEDLRKNIEMFHRIPITYNQRFFVEEF